MVVGGTPETGVTVQKTRGAAMLRPFTSPCEDELRHICYNLWALHGCAITGDAKHATFLCSN